VLDLTTGFALGGSRLHLGIENLLDATYFDVVSQLDLTDGNAYYTAARGRAFTVGYSVAY
jgi:outer membrane receptor protein involved in Fe transport